MANITSYISEQEDGFTLEAVVNGMHCISCANAIERKLNAEDDVENARINLSANHLTIKWQGNIERGNVFFDMVDQMGYQINPFQDNQRKNVEDDETRSLLKAIAVSGFAMGNIMLLSFGVWANTNGDMGEATLQMLHWVSAIIALPTVLYAGRPFFKSSFLALKSRTTNMDVPISVAIILTTLMSIYETFITNSEDVYFDSVVMLMFFLLIGRYLNAKARGKAKSAAQDMMAMMVGYTQQITCCGKRKEIPYKDIKEDMTLEIAAGEKIPADGMILEGQTELDTSMLTGETLPQAGQENDTVLAGMVNLNKTIKMKVTKPGEQSLLRDIIRLMEKAEQGDARFVRISDRVAQLYTPVVHLLGALSFCIWYFLLGATFHQALIIAISVLIITCPCALGLAVPVVQVLASSRLFKNGVIIKSADAFERIVRIDQIIFDKTGTLTTGSLSWVNADDINNDDQKLAASLAQKSKHPLSKAVTAHYEGETYDLDVTEVPGCGLEAEIEGKKVKLGKASWVDAEIDNSHDHHVDLWISIDGKKPTRLIFSDQLRCCAKSTVQKLLDKGIACEILSGDRKEVVANVANDLNITDYQAQILPNEKCDVVEKHKSDGKYVLMVGDGLNDAPALAMADVSISPSSAMDITQNAADIVFQGKKLSPLLDIYETASVTQKLTKENIGLAVLYNAIAIPVAMTGVITPLIAAISMSASSLVVIANALRLNPMIKKRLS